MLALAWATAAPSSRCWDSMTLGAAMPTGSSILSGWTDVFGSECLTHHANIGEMNGDSYRLRHSGENADSQAPDDPGEE